MNCKKLSHRKEKSEASSIEAEWMTVAVPTRGISVIDLSLRLYSLRGGIASLGIRIDRKIAKSCRISFKICDSSSFL